MKFVRRVSLYVAILVLGGILAYFFIIKNPASRSLDELLTRINDTRNISLDDYILPELNEDPFIRELADQNIIVDHRILGSQRWDNNDVKINVSLISEYGAFDVGFIMTKVNNKWFVSQFPSNPNRGCSTDMG